MKENTAPFCAVFFLFLFYYAPFIFSLKIKISL
nr:MAG TPA: hypothetical protein [Caudoviricetes sp.]